MEPNQKPLDIPEEVQQRIKIWQKLFLRSNYAHYFFGIVGIAAASISAATDGGLSKLLAAASAVCIGVLGFAQPDRKYVKFVHAWRILYIASLRYRYRQITIEELFTDFSALCSRPGFTRPPGESPMKVLMIKWFLATRPSASKSCLSILAPAGTRFASVPVTPGSTGRQNRGQNLFCFMYFHGP